MQMQHVCVKVSRPPVAPLNQHANYKCFIPAAPTPTPTAPTPTPAAPTPTPAAPTPTPAAPTPTPAAPTPTPAAPGMFVV
jgi:hypothetical protein